MTDVATAGVNIPDTNPIPAPNGVINNITNNNNNRPRPVVSSNLIEMLFPKEIKKKIIVSGSINKRKR